MAFVTEDVKLPANPKKKSARRSINSQPLLLGSGLGEFHA